MTQRFKISERELTQLINECVTQAINEISMDTIDSAIDKANNNVHRNNYYAASTAKKNKAKQQYNNLCKGRAERMGYDPRSGEADAPENAYKQSRWEDNNTKRRQGTRRYKDGKWSNGYESYSDESQRKTKEAIAKRNENKKKGSLVDKLKGLVGKK